MGHHRIKLRKLSFQPLVDQKEGLERATDIAIAARHDFVDGGFAWSGSHQNSPIVSWNYPAKKPWDNFGVRPAFPVDSVDIANDDSFDGARPPRGKVADNDYIKLPMTIV
jgi:hypothetical protein